MEDKMIVIAGEVGYVAGFPSDFGVGDILEPKSVFESPPMDLEAHMKFYLPDPDKIRTVKITGVQADVNDADPTHLDRMSVNYHIIARLFAENELGVHDIREILGAALAGDGVEGPNMDYGLFQKVDKLHHLLGGME